MAAVLSEACCRVLALPANAGLNFSAGADLKAAMRSPPASNKLAFAHPFPRPLNPVASTKARPNRPRLARGFTWAQRTAEFL